MQLSIRSSSAAERGNATVIAVIVLLVIGSLAGVVLSVSQRHSAEVSALADQNRAFFVAQTGVNDALASLEGGSTDSIGSSDEPIKSTGGSYWVEMEDTGSSTYTLTSHARAGLQDKAIEVVVEQLVQGVFRNGIFAGNSSGDPTYSLDLSGTGGQADKIQGDVYSGGSVKVSGDADVQGIIRAVNTVTGKGSSTAETGNSQAIPDLAGMNYAATADVKVANEFSGASAKYLSDDSGGKAWQMPESNPAHIFRKNPNDRTSETGGTTKDDYFLEDPYEKLDGGSSSNGSDAYAVTLSGVSGEPGTSSNKKVFYIDGNLWMHNYHTRAFKFSHKDKSGLQVTFVVKGNIYISDNVHYSDNKKDGVAFIAMKDSKVADSGNIYFGDPAFGTLERMSGFMYAENNFYDLNLDETGSAKVDLFGNMTAGNQVKINRDFVVKVGKLKVVKHTRLNVDFDERLSDGSIELPGLPETTSGEGSSIEVLSWREVEH